MTLTPVPDDFGQPEPHDLAAEQAVLGAMMLSAAAADRCRQALVPDDFYRPAHSMIFAAITTLLRSSSLTYSGDKPGFIADMVTVKDRLDATGDLVRCGGAPYLHTLIAAVPAVANADYYARIVREHAVTRRVRIAARRIMQMTEPGTDTDAHGLTEFALREMEAVRDAGVGDGLTVQTITEFLEAGENEPDYDWVVPGLLERGDRLILTGAEGAGKSELFRLCAVTIAAGIHPFTFQAIEPQRVLVLDCENTSRHTRRKIRPLIAQAKLQGHPVSEANLWIECRPQGIDLALDKDLSWLMRQVAAVTPDVTFLGPLYRLAPRALNDDSDAAPVIAALNMIRARGSAVVLEAHSGHAIGPGGRRDPRPRGSSAFLGWPEFGYGLRWAEKSTKQNRLVELVGWRGDRDEREWPPMLAGGGVWPWHPYYPPPDDDSENTYPWSA